MVWHPKLSDIVTAVDGGRAHIRTIHILHTPNVTTIIFICFTVYLRENYGHPRYASRVHPCLLRYQYLEALGLLDGRCMAYFAWLLARESGLYLVR